MVSVVDILGVNSAIGVAKAAELSILSNVKAEAVTSDIFELMNSLTSLEIKALSTEILITAAREDHILARDEADAVHNRVIIIAVFVFAPQVLDHRSVERAKIPDLDAFTESSTTRHAVVVAVAHVNGISSDGSLTSNGHAEATRSHVPEADLSV